MLNNKISLPQSVHSPFGLPSIALLHGVEHGLSIVPAAAFSGDFRPVESENSAWIYPEQEIKRLLVNAFKEIPQVEGIYVQFGTEEITIWTLLDSYNRKARSKVHVKELEICQTLHVYDFDFRVTSTDVVPPQELEGNGMRKIYKRS